MSSAHQILGWENPVNIRLLTQEKAIFFQCWPEFPGISLHIFLLRRISPTSPITYSEIKYACFLAKEKRSWCISYHLCMPELSKELYSNRLYLSERNTVLIYTGIIWNTLGSWVVICVASQKQKLLWMCVESQYCVATALPFNEKPVFLI